MQIISMYIYAGTYVCTIVAYTFALHYYIQYVCISQCVYVCRYILPVICTCVDFEMRCPKGKKTILYKRAKVEKYAEYLNQDGLVLRLTKYNNLEREFVPTCTYTCACSCYQW